MTRSPENLASIKANLAKQEDMLAKLRAADAHPETIADVEALIVGYRRMLAGA